MNTIPELIELARARWDDAETLGFVGGELESRSRLPIARSILTRAIELSPLAHPEWYLSLAFAHFRDVGNLAGEGERILLDGIETTNSDFLKAAYLSVLEADAEQVSGLVGYLSGLPNLSVRFALGYSLLWRGESARALAMLRKAAERLDADETPLGLDLYCGALNWLAAQEGSDVNLRSEVLPRIDRLITRHPNVYNYRALKIQAFQALRDYAAVREAALETLKVFPDEETTMMALGSAREKLGDDDGAILWYNRAIGAKPSYARARMMLARLYERRGALALAEEVVREIPAAFPEFHPGKLEVAYFLHRVGKTSEALSMFRFGYERLKPFEKPAVETHPEGRQMLAALATFALPVLQYPL